MEHDVRTFDDIVGHGKQVALLRRTLASGRVADGYLFAGPAHIGKKTAATPAMSTTNNTMQMTTIFFMVSPSRH